MGNMNMQQKQKGNIILVLLGIVAVVVLIGAYAMSGKTEGQSSAGASVAASAIASDGQALSQTAQTIALNLTTTVPNLTFSPAAANAGVATNIIGTTAPAQGMQDPVPAAQALRSSSALTAVEGYYAFIPTGTGPGGVGGYPAIALGGVTDATCKAYMQNIYGANGVGPQPAGTSEATFLGTITTAAPTVTTAEPTSLANASKGVCYTTSDGADHNIIIYLL